jgi:hypothetical protein
MEVWEQHEGEPGKAYERFLFYRDLGPTRSLDAAYEAYINSEAFEAPNTKSLEKASRGIKRYRAPGQWREDCVTYQWVFRANQWDIFMLSVAGKSVISDFYKLLAVMTNQTLETMRKGQLVPVTYGQALEGLQILGNYVSPEAVAAWALDSGDKTEEPAPEPENVSSIDAKRRAV